MFLCCSFVHKALLFALKELHNYSLVECYMYLVESGHGLPITAMSLSPSGDFVLAGNQTGGH